jgi:four helix bundle protein
LGSAEKLEVFQRAHRLVLEVYRFSEGCPKAERFGLTAQMRRAAISIPLNLAEGSRRLPRKEYRQFVSIARGSAGEPSYCLLLARELGYMDGEGYERLSGEAEGIGKMLTALLRALARD